MKTAGLNIKTAAPSNYAQDFLAGLDPFGAWTNEYGLEAERAGLSEGEHALKRGIGTTGGVVGGAALVPSAIMGVTEGAKGFAGAKGGIGARLAAGAAGGLKGIKQPIKSVSSALTGRKGLRRVAEGGAGLTNKEQKSLLYLGENAGVTPQVVADKLQALTPTAKRQATQTAQKAVENPADVVARTTGHKELGDAAQRAAQTRQGQDVAQRVGDEAGRATAKELGSLGDAFRNADPEQIRRVSTTADGRTLAREIEPALTSQLRGGVAQLGLGGAIGGGGAYYQYGAGRETERQTTPWARAKRMFTE